MFKPGDICLTDYYLWYNPNDFIGAVVELGFGSSGFDFTISKHICIPQQYIGRETERVGMGWGVRMPNLTQIRSIHDMLPDFQRAAHINATPNFKKFLRDLLTKEFGEIPEESLEVLSKDNPLGITSAEGISNEGFLSIEKPKVRSYSILPVDVPVGDFQYLSWINMNIR